jgi:hypothetical protein
MEKLVKIIEKSCGRFFKATFIKKDGTVREMVARTGVKAHLKGGATKYDGSKFISVYDVQAKGYRLINKETLRSVKFGGKVYGNK